MLCEKRNSGDVKQIGDFLFDERLKWLHGGYYVITGDQSINQAKNIFERKKINEWYWGIQHEYIVWLGLGWLDGVVPFT